MLNYLNARILMQTGLMVALTAPMAFSQTQRTSPSAYATMPTLTSAFPTAPQSPCYRYSWLNPTSSCYSGTAFPTFSATDPSGPAGTKSQQTQTGSVDLNESQARLRIETKGYGISGLWQDKRGIWRGQGTLDDGRNVEVTLDLEGNVYSRPVRLPDIRIERAPYRRPSGGESPSN